jgi:hypothetical protein
MKILLDLNAKVGRKNIFKPIIQNESLHEINNYNKLRVVTFVTSKYLIIKSTVFPHCNIHKYTCTSDRKTHNQIDHVLIGKRWQSNVVDVQSGADCDTNHSKNSIRLKSQ